jgi:hypothetical protein
MLRMGSVMHLTHPNTTGEQSEKFVSAEDVATRYKVTSRAVLQWAARGIIPSIRIGKKTVRFNIVAVRVALEGGVF